MSARLTTSITRSLTFIAACVLLALAAMATTTFLPSSAWAAEQGSASLQAATLQTMSSGRIHSVSGTIDKCAVEKSSYYGSYTSAVFTFKVKGLTEYSSVWVVKDSNKKGSAHVVKVANNKLKLRVTGAGTHKITLSADGQQFKCTAILRTLSFKDTGAIQPTGAVVAFPNQDFGLAVGVTGISNPEVAWSTSNANVATVDGNGYVKTTGKGRCYLYAEVQGARLKLLVEVTSWQACQAVYNGFSDWRTNIQYDQGLRMSPGYRDCGSFVSRCYWDETQGRYLYCIGNSGSWALNAAAQAQWLDANGKRVSYGPCSVSKLLPGDTMYFETRYSDQYKTEWRNIDHAGMYVGNGYFLQTHGGSYNKGCIGLTRLDYYSSPIKFIGRPVA